MGELSSNLMKGVGGDAGATRKDYNPDPRPHRYVILGGNKVAPDSKNGV
jgi:hypothetical protein